MTGGKNDAAKGKAGDDATGTVTAPAPDRRRRLILIGIAAVVVIAVVVLIILLNRDDTSGTGNAASTTSAAATDTSVVPNLPTPTPTGPTEVVDQPPPALPEVALDAEAAVGNGIVASLPSIESIQGSAVGPGNIAGPALRVTVRIVNGTAEAVPLDGVAVNMSYGTDHTPASPLDDPSRRPFGGLLAAGDSADAIYVFSVPADARDSVTIEVGYQAGAPLLLFTGPVG